MPSSASFGASDQTLDHFPTLYAVADLYALGRNSHPPQVSPHWPSPCHHMGSRPGLVRAVEHSPLLVQFQTGFISGLAGVMWLGAREEFAFFESVGVEPPRTFLP
jgi:hypothetical protein